MNNSGLWPVGFSVLVLPDQIQEKTEAGIIRFTPEQKDREQLAQTEGIVIAIAPSAWIDEKQPRAKIGDRVVISKYAGMIKKGKDDLDYRLIWDKDIVGVLEKEQEND